MSDKKTPGGDGADRNVDQIRDILFGGQMRDYERRFQELAGKLEQESARMRADFDKRVAALEKRLDEQVEKIGKSLRQEVSDRGKAVDDVEARTLQAARTLRNELNGAIEHLAADLGKAEERARDAQEDLAAAIKRAAADAEAALSGARGELRAEKVGRDDMAALLTEMALRLRGEFDLPAGKK